MTEQTKPLPKPVPLTQEDFNALLKKVNDELQSEIDAYLKEDYTLKVLHVSHRLQNSGLKHSRGYDRTKYNGITFGLLTDNISGEIKVYSYLWKTSEGFSKLEGRSGLLRLIKINLQETAEGLIVPRYNPVVLDKEEAYKYLDMSDEASAQKTNRAIVDWYIRTHVNEPTVAKPKKVVILRSQLKELEEALADMIASQLNNTVKVRVVYEYVTETKKKSVLEHTLAKVIITDKGTLDEETLRTLEVELDALTIKVTRYPSDAPNRLFGRYVAVNKLAKAIS